MAIKLIIVALVVTACGGGGANPEHPGAPLAFKDMNLDQRIEFMKTTVLPRAKTLFVAFDPKFQNMNCETCHGDGAKDGTWKLPNPKIHALPNSEELFVAWVQKSPDEARWAQFMATQLEPEVAKMVGKTPFNPQTKTGDFGCSVCHTLSATAGQ
jgi:acetone carboxylase gamma subunit